MIERAVMQTMNKLARICRDEIGRGHTGGQGNLSPDDVAWTVMACVLP